MKSIVKVAVTGACGNIGYALLFRIARGDVFGFDQPVELRLLERESPESAKKMQGLLMELNDCAFPLLSGIVCSTDPNECFKDVDAAFLVGAKPRTEGMDRADLLKDNGKIFTVQGKALNDNAKPGVLVIVVGNPCNTNAWIAMQSAPKLAPECFSAMMRLDQNRMIARIAEREAVSCDKVKKAFVWGNHSNSQIPDITFVEVEGKSEFKMGEEEYASFRTAVATRGGAIIKARGASSAASAANAAIDHMRDWWQGSDGRIVTMAVPSDGSYGIEKGIVYGFPVICKGRGQYEIVKNLPVTPATLELMKASEAELIKEREVVKELL
ncbi:MAG TPA: malate dehydrogenase [Sutterella sp.]|nr:malate dehydrogenase [Sutterella sp.]